MTANSAENVENYLCNLKQRLDEVWEQFGKDPSLEKLIYAKDYYGVMQRAELKDIYSALTALKTRVDGLLSECMTIPADRRVSCSDLRKLPTDEENDGLY